MGGRKAASRFGRESPNTPAAREAIRQDCYSDGEVLQRLVGPVQDKAKAKELLAKHPTLPDGSHVLALDHLEMQKEVLMTFPDAATVARSGAITAILYALAIIVSRRRRW
jgi:hypothetical protein